MDGKYMVNEKYSFKLSNYAKDLLYLYFLGLSLRNTSKALVIFRDVNMRSYVSVWNWIQRFAEYPNYKRKRMSAFIIDESYSNI